MADFLGLFISGLKAIDQVDHLQPLSSTGAPTSPLLANLVIWMIDDYTFPYLQAYELSHPDTLIRPLEMAHDRNGVRYSGAVGRARYSGVR